MSEATQWFVFAGTGIIFFSESVPPVSRERLKSSMLMYYQSAVVSLKLSNAVSVGHKTQP